MTKLRNTTEAITGKTSVRSTRLVRWSTGSPVLMHNGMAYETTKINNKYYLTGNYSY